MEERTRLLVFSVDDQRFALSLASVERVVRAVAITPLPGAPEIVTGVVNVGGRIFPVVSIRRRWGLAPHRQLALTDHLILARTARRPVALLADAVIGLLEHPTSDIVRAESILADLDQVEGVVRLDGGLILVHDLDRFLSLGEEEGLARALSAKSETDDANCSP